MKKISLFVLVLVALWTSTAFAQMVRVSDDGAERLYEKVQEAASSRSIELSAMRNLGWVEHGQAQNYQFSCGASGTTESFLVVPDGYVFAIDICYDTKDNADALVMLRTTCDVLGVSVDEYESLLNSIQARNGYIASDLIWCEGLQRAVGFGVQSMGGTRMKVSILGFQQ